MVLLPIRWETQSQSVFKSGMVFETPRPRHRNDHTSIGTALDDTFTNPPGQLFVEISAGNPNFSVDTESHYPVIKSVVRLY